MFKAFTHKQQTAALNRMYRPIRFYQSSLNITYFYTVLNNLSINVTKPPPDLGTISNFFVRTQSGHQIRTIKVGNLAPSLLMKDWVSQRCSFQTHSWYYHLLPINLFTCGMFLNFPSLLLPLSWLLLNVLLKLMKSNIKRMFSLFSTFN